MILQIEISKNDFKAVKSTTMTIDEMDNTVKGRIYISIIRAYKNEHPEEFRSCYRSNPIE